MSGRIWRRLAAGAVDLLLAAVAGSLLAVAVYVASGGAVRAPTLLPITQCQQLAGIPSDALAAARARAPLKGVQPVGALLCRHSFLGLESGRDVIVQQAGVRGATLQVFGVVQPVDRTGRSIAPVMLGVWYPFLLILLAALAESLFGETPGKSLLGLKVRSPGGGRLPPARALARKFLAWAVLPALVLWPLILRETGALGGLPPGLRTLPVFLAVAWAPIALVGLASLAALLSGRPDPAYDRVTGARVTPS